MLTTQQELKKYLLNKRANGKKSKGGQREGGQAESEDGPRAGAQWSAGTSGWQRREACGAAGPLTNPPD